MNKSLYVLRRSQVLEGRAQRAERLQYRLPFGSRAVDDRLIHFDKRHDPEQRTSRTRSTCCGL